MITVYNKVDLADGPVPDSNNRAVFISAQHPETLPPLFSAMENVLAARICTLNLLIPYSDGNIQHFLREKGQILSEEYAADGIQITASINRQYQKKLEPYCV